MSADGTTHERDLTQLPLFGPEQALCEQCELCPQRDKGMTALAYRPDDFCGVMIIGEGPGHQEVAQGRPFVGPSGKLLRRLLSSIGQDMDRCYVTNSTLCRPPPKEGGLFAAFPNAIPSCLPRLEAEIEAVRPRVIITLGAAAFIAVSGYDRVKHVQEPFECDNCNANRKVGPVLQCSAKVPNPEDGGKTSTACGHLHFLKADNLETVNVDELEALRDGGCTSCGAKMRRQRPKFVKCPKCGGRKTRTVERVIFTHDYKLNEVAGAVFQPGVAGRELAQNELDPWLGEQGVRYVIPTLHPAFLLRDQQFLAKPVQKHLMKAFALCERAPRWTESYEVTTDPEIVREFCFGWRKRGEPAPNFAVDIETEGRIVTKEDGTTDQLDARKIRNVAKIRCIGIGTPQHCIVVDTRDIDPRNADIPMLDALQDFLEDDEIPKTFHNGLYDISVIDRIWGVPWERMAPSYADDTLGAHAAVYPDEPHELSHVARAMTEAPAWKPPRHIKGALVHKDFDELALYNARDIFATARSREALGVDRGRVIPHERADRAGLSKVYEIDAQLKRLALSMTMHGMPLDLAAFREAGARARKNIDEALTNCRRLLQEKTGVPDPEAFNPFAPAQVAEALFGERGFRLTALSTTKTGQASTGADDLRRIRTMQDIWPEAREFINALLAVREHHKIKATYIESAAMQPWEDGRMHALWKPWGARTGRFSSEPNFQNFPIWLRIIIAALEGRRFVAADYDQLELRGSAALTGDAELIRRCLNADESRKLEPDHDPHSYVAAMAFADAYTALLLKDPAHDPETKCRCETCRRKALRDLIKRVVYGLNYGAGEATILDAIYSTGDYVGPPITLEMVAHVKRTFFKQFPDVPRWRDEAMREARRTGELRSPLHGRRRIFPLDEVPLTEVYNYPVQSFAADIMNEQSLLFAARLPGVDPSAFIFAQVHDALYVECDEDRADDVAHLLEDSLSVEHTLRPGAPAMRFTAHAKVSTDWRS